VALARRSPAADQADAGVLDRIDREAVRLSQIVEDLLFLARSEAEPPPPSDELVDLGTLVAASAERFATIAASRRVGLVSHPPPGGAQIHAPAEWIDRLLGILLDNACRYAADGGTVAVRATVAGRRAGILVEDDGPGIPENERARLFDRFHRADDRPGGHGLGLAIADSIVRSTRGQWQIGDSSYGGAQMEVSWPLRQRVRRHR
jgi:signal transduction histidine kinase